MGANLADPGVGGGELAVLWTILQGHGLSRPDIRDIIVVTDAQDGPDPRGIPPQGGLLDYGATAVARSRHGVVLPKHRGGYEGGGSGED